MSWGVPTWARASLIAATTVEHTLGAAERLDEPSKAAPTPEPEEDITPSSRAPSALVGQLDALAARAAGLAWETPAEQKVIVYVARILRSHARRLGHYDRLDWLRVEELLRWQAGVFRAPKIPGLAETLDEALAAVTRTIHVRPVP